MPAITRNITIILLLLTFNGSLWAQRSNWNVSASPKRCTVIIPGSLDLDLPGNATYQIGFFVFTNNILVNMGSATYTPSQDLQIHLAYDPQGITGYKDNQRLITLIRNTSDQDSIFGIEFTYQNDQNRFILDGTVTVKGVRYTTWEKIIDASLCQSIEQYELKIPYGLRPAINFRTNIRHHQDEDGRYYIDLSEMQGANIYSLEFPSLPPPYVKYSQYFYSFNLQYFPVEVLNAHYEICPGGMLTLEDTIEVDRGVLTRAPYGSTTSLTIMSEGNYSYEYSFVQSPCKVVDTIRVTYKEDCKNSGYPELINPIAGQEIIFTKGETVRVYDAAMTKVSEFTSPTIWRGTDQNGNVLAPGLYFMIHEDGTTHDVTIMY